MENNNYNDPFYGDEDRNDSQGHNNPGSNNAGPYSNQNQVFLKNVLPVILAVLLLGTGFLLGFFIKGFTQSKEELLAEWMFDTIKDKYLYYDDLTDAEKSLILENMGRGAVYSLDRYSDFLIPVALSEIEEEREGNFTDIGFSYGQAKDDNGTFTYISQVFGDYQAPNEGLIESPANKAGLKEYDRFVSLIYYTNAERTQIVSKESHGAFPNKVRFERNYSDGVIEYATINDIYYAINDIPAGITFDLKMKRLVTDENAPDYLEYVEMDFTLKKETHKPSYVEYSSIDNNTAVVDLMSFNTVLIEDQVKAAMEKFKNENKKNLILDLRNNGGGYLDVFEEISSYFVTDSKGSNKILAGYSVDKKGARTNYHTSKNNYNSLIEKIVILFNENTASASEALMGAIIDNDYQGIVKTVGKKSFGKGIYQSRYPNERLGYAIVLTNGYMYWPSGKTIHNDGVDPNKEVSDDYFITGIDNQLLTAIDYMKGLIQIP